MSKADPHLRDRRKLFAVVGALFVADLRIARAEEAKSFSRTVAGAEISFPVLPGFSSPDSVPLYKQQSIAQNYRGARLLAFYPAEMDVSGVSPAGRFISVITKVEPPTSISVADARKMSAMLRQAAMDAVRKDLRPDAAETEVLAEMKRRFDEPTLKIQDGGDQILGVFDEQPSASTLVVVQKAPGGQPIAMAMTQVVKKGGLLNVYTTSPYRSQRDVRWVLNVTQTWLSQFEDLNPD